MSLKYTYFEAKVNTSWFLKSDFFEGWSWLKFNNLGLVLGMALKSFNIVVKSLKLKFKIWELIPTFGEVSYEKLVGVPSVVKHTHTISWQTRAVRYKGLLLVKQWYTVVYVVFRTPFKIFFRKNAWPIFELLNF